MRKYSDFIFSMIIFAVKFLWLCYVELLYRHICYVSRLFV